MSEISFPGGWSARGRQRQRLLATLALTLDFHTWKRLVLDEKVKPDEAVQMMIGLVRHTVHPELDAVTG